MTEKGRGNPEEQVRVVLVTMPDMETGLGLSRAMVEEKLAACANLAPGITSIYRWAGEVQEDEEVLLVLKTTSSSLDRLMSRVRDLHPYDVPEILALPVTEGHPPYLSWVMGEVASP